MKKVLAVVVMAALCAMALPAGAQDEVLLQDMANLEKAYIPPLFYTSAQQLAPSVKSMNIYKAEWRAFANAYYNYRPDEANWKNYFDLVERAIQEADAIVASGQNLTLAHDALEHVRLTMRQLRIRNGFPKFSPDTLTAFHDPMEAIVLSVKGKTPDQIDDALIASLYDLLSSALFLWDKVEKCPLDPILWHFTDTQTSNYYQYLLSERTALEAFETALNSGDKAAIIAKGVAIKPTFVNTYTLFGDFARITGTTN